MEWRNSSRNALVRPEAERGHPNYPLLIEADLAVEAGRRNELG